jgi:hypothetical protein
VFPVFTGVCLVDFSCSFAFADEQSAQKFNRERELFIQVNNRDMHYEYATVDDQYVEPNGFVALDGVNSLRLISLRAYSVLSIFMLSVPFRMWLNSISAHQTLKFKRYLWKA